VSEQIIHVQAWPPVGLALPFVCLLSLDAWRSGGRIHDQKEEGRPMNDNDVGSITSLLPLVVWSLIAIIPAISMCGRTGKTRWWAVIAVIPFIGPLILLFVFAYSRWVVTPTPNTEVRSPARS
jgi:uncharacterized membrane protein YhaH (DUF805 family)